MGPLGGLSPLPPAPHASPRTSNDLLQLVHVVVLLAIVHDGLHREDELWLNLRKPVQNALEWKERVVIVHPKGKILQQPRAQLHLQGCM